MSFTIIVKKELCTTASQTGAYPGTSTIAPTNSTLSYVRSLAEFGWKESAKKDKALKGDST